MFQGRQEPCNVGMSEFLLESSLSQWSWKEYVKVTRFLYFQKIVSDLQFLQLCVYCWPWPCWCFFSSKAFYLLQHSTRVPLELSLTFTNPHWPVSSADILSHLQLSPCLVSCSSSWPGGRSSNPFLLSGADSHWDLMTVESEVLECRWTLPVTWSRVLECRWTLAVTWSHSSYFVAFPSSRATSLLSGLCRHEHDSCGSCHIVPFPGTHLILAQHGFFSSHPRALGSNCYAWS